MYLRRKFVSKYKIKDAYKRSYISIKVDQMKIIKIKFNKIKKYKCYLNRSQQEIIQNQSKLKKPKKIYFENV